GGSVADVDGEPQGAGQGEESAGPTDGEPAGAGAAVLERDQVPLTLVTDLRCNVGMAPVVGAVVELSGSELVLNAGDTVMGGTSVESVCVNAFADGIPAGVPV